MIDGCATFYERVMIALHTPAPGSKHPFYPLCNSPLLLTAHKLKEFPCILEIEIPKNRASTGKAGNLRRRRKRVQW